MPVPMRTSTGPSQTGMVETNPAQAAADQGHPDLRVALAPQSGAQARVFMSASGFVAVYYPFLRYFDLS